MIPVAVIELDENTSLGRVRLMTHDTLAILDAFYGIDANIDAAHAYAQATERNLKETAALAKKLSLKTDWNSEDFCLLDGCRKAISDFDEEDFENDEAIVPQTVTD